MDMCRGMQLVIVPNAANSNTATPTLLPSPFRAIISSFTSVTFARHDGRNRFHHVLPSILQCS